MDEVEEEGEGLKQQFVARRRQEAENKVLKV